MVKIHWIVFLVFFSIRISGQEKSEIETFIPLKQVPPRAVELVCNILPEAKGKWFYEVSNGVNSYEAKVKSGGKRYSIEFSRNGDFEDIEEEVLLSQITKEVQQNIKQQLEKDFIKYKVKRLQRRYSGEIDEIKKILNKKIVQSEYVVSAYEMEVVGKSKKDEIEYEYVLDVDGEFVERFIIVERNTDNLFF